MGLGLANENVGWGQELALWETERVAIVNVGLLLILIYIFVAGSTTVIIEVVDEETGIMDREWHWTDGTRSV